MEVNSILKTKTYELTEEKVLIIKNQLGREGLQLIKTITSEKKKTCKAEKGYPLY